MICAIAVAEVRFVNVVERGPVDVSAIPETRKSLVSVRVCVCRLVSNCNADISHSCAESVKVRPTITSAQLVSNR